MWGMDTLYFLQWATFLRAENTPTTSHSLAVDPFFEDGILCPCLFNLEIPKDEPTPLKNCIQSRSPRRPLLPCSRDHPPHALMLSWMFFSRRFKTPQ